jgi:hypothetical protein
VPNRIAVSPILFATSVALHRYVARHGPVGLVDRIFEVADGELL